MTSSALAMVSSSGRMPVERVGFVALIFAAVLYLGSGSGAGSSYASMRQLEDVQLSLAGAERPCRISQAHPRHRRRRVYRLHATLRLLEDGYAVTIVDNYSRGNRGAIEALRKLAPKNKLRVVDGDLGVQRDLERAFGKHKVDAVIHFAAIAYVGESVAQPLAYYRNVTVNTIGLLEAMRRHDVRKLVYSSTCATYGNPDELPITEKTPTVPINPYGKSKLYAEDAIRDYAVANKDFDAAILRYFNVFGSDPRGRLGEFPRPELRAMGRISGACFDAALGNIPELVVMGTDFPTRDGTCIRDYVHAADLVDAHLAVLGHVANPPVLYNVGTGKGVTVREFVDACKRVTGVDVTVREQRESRPGDYAEVYADVSKIREELGWEARYVDGGEFGARVGVEERAQGRVLMCTSSVALE